MKTTYLLVTVLTLLWSSMSFAAGNQYDIRVDGLACPFCAFGIEKKFVNTDGVDKVEFDMVKGLVIVTTADSKTFTGDQLKEIINDSGFTMKSMTQKTL